MKPNGEVLNEYPSGFTKNDAIGRRTVATINGTTTSYLYDHANGVQETRGASTTSFVAEGIDGWLAQIEGTEVRSFVTDVAGSTIQLADTNKDAVASYTYEPFGRTTVQNPGATSRQFTGREDDANGLYYFRARYYAPALGRFMAEDSLSSLESLNLYTYVDNDPIDYTDPLGLFKVCCRPVRALKDQLCHCWIGLSDGRTIGAYNMGPYKKYRPLTWTLLRQWNNKDDTPTPSGACCKDYGGDSSDDQ